jgi:hypothetical protein
MDVPERREFARETAHCYFDAKGRRQNKVTSWEQFYATEDEAVAGIAANKARAANQDRADRIRRAASELLEALTIARDLIAGDLVGAEWKQACHDFLRQANAAIAKATGEAQ